MKHIVVLSGAGISAESGIKTFRDADGLWEGHDIMEVATPQAWHKNKSLVLDFYNQRRRQLHEVSPNSAHIALASLEKKYKLSIITQNVDNLHEKAGSTNVLHLHGELFKVRSTLDPHLIYHWEKDLHLGDLCSKGHQLRPHIVWFGEEVPLLPTAAETCATADIFIVIGTSLQVYPAAGLLQYVPRESPIYYIDPKPANIKYPQLHVLPFIASEGMKQLLQQLL